MTYFLISLTLSFFLTLAMLQTYFPQDTVLYSDEKDASLCDTTIPTIDTRLSSSVQYFIATRTSSDGVSSCDSETGQWSLIDLLEVEVEQEEMVFQWNLPEEERDILVKLLFYVFDKNELEMASAVQCSSAFYIQGYHDIIPIMDMVEVHYVEEEKSSTASVTLKCMDGTIVYVFINYDYTSFDYVVIDQYPDKAG